MFDRVKELSDKKGISLTELAQKMEWADKAIYNWKTSKPSIDKVEKVADYFGVSTDYLLSRTDNPKMADEAPTLLAAHIEDDLSEEEMEEVLQYIEFIRSKHKK